jgi:hypothetical protein
MTEKVHVQSGQEARYWKAVMLWRLGEFNPALRGNEPNPAHTAYGVAATRAAHIRTEVTDALAGAGLPTVSRPSRYDVGLQFGDRAGSEVCERLSLVIERRALRREFSEVHRAVHTGPASPE